LIFNPGYKIKDPIALVDPPPGQGLLFGACAHLELLFDDREPLRVGAE